MFRLRRFDVEHDGPARPKAFPWGKVPQCAHWGG